LLFTAAGAGAGAVEEVLVIAGDKILIIKINNVRYKKNNQYTIIYTLMVILMILILVLLVLNTLMNLCCLLVRHCHKVD
jgi:hypothetical protein